jgi:sporulation protein YlmC with PRC-barrel domain
MKEVHVEHLLGRRVVDSEGRRIGRIHEIQAERGDKSCTVESFHVGNKALIERLAKWAVPARFGELIQSKLARPYSIPWEQMDLGDPLHPRTTVPRKELRRAG